MINGFKFLRVEDKEGRQKKVWVGQTHLNFIYYTYTHTLAFMYEAPGAKVKHALNKQ